MKLYERLRATVTAGVDNAVSQIEKHIAVVEAALTDTRSAAEKARARIARVNKDGDALRHKLASLQQSANQWQNRALSVADTDEQKALQCLQRRNTRRQEAQQARVALTRHSELETSVASSVDHFEQQLEALTQQRNVMRSFHSAAEAQRIINTIVGQSASVACLDDTFDRWETRITEMEHTTSRTPAVDILESAFVNLENEDQLKAELDALRHEESSTSVAHDSSEVH
ncbi:MAG: PspA/IM30 family protein [Pseudomonadales bacterium]